MLINKTPSQGNWSREMLSLSIPSGTVFLALLQKKWLRSLTPFFHSCGISNQSSSWQQPSSCFTPALAQHSSGHTLPDGAAPCQTALLGPVCPGAPEQGLKHHRRTLLGAAWLPPGTATKDTSHWT